MRFNEIYKNEDEHYSICIIDETQIYAMKIDNMVEEGTAFFYLTPKEAELYQNDSRIGGIFANRLKITVPGNRFILASTQKKVTPSQTPMKDDDEYVQYMKTYIYTKQDLIDSILNPEKINVNVLGKMSVNDITTALLTLNTADESIKNTQSHIAKVNFLSSFLYTKIKISKYIYCALTSDADLYLNDQKQLFFFSKHEFAQSAKEHFSKENINFEIEKIENKDFPDLFKKLEKYKDLSIVLDIGFNPVAISCEPLIPPHIPVDKEFYDKADIDTVIGLQNKAKSVVPITEESKKMYGFVSLQLAKKLCSDSVYIIYDNSLGVRFPYIDNEGFAWLFSKKEYAQEAVEFYKNELKISVKEIEKKHIPAYMLFCREIGINVFRVNNGHVMGEIPREYFLPKITDLRNIVVKNSEYLLYNAIRFIQANNCDSDSSKIISKRVMPDMCVGISKSVYLIPIVMSENKDDSFKTIFVNKDFEEKIMNGLNLTGIETKYISERFQVHLLKKENTDIMFLPLFTSVSQFKLAFEDKNVKIQAVTFEQVEKMVNDKVYGVIDCMGINFILNEKSIMETKKIVDLVEKSK